jgi:hypothetical protein
VNVWCRDHAQLLGLVRLHGCAWPEFASRSPRWHKRNSIELRHGEDHFNSWTNLREWTRPEIEAKGCQECGPRMLAVSTLLEAFENGRDKISL